jgi:hypothetical protein
MNIACTVSSEKQNMARAASQTCIHASLFAKIDAWNEENRFSTAPSCLPPVEWTYNVMSEFTREYIRSYMPDPSKEQDLRFLPFLEIDRTHPVHFKALDFQKGQDVLYGTCRMPGLRGYSVMSYAELVQLSVVRILESSECP